MEGTEKFEAGFNRLYAEKKVAAQLGNISFLKRIGRTISSVSDFETVVGPLLRQIRTILGVDAASLYLLEKGTNFLLCKAHDGFETKLVEKAKVKLGERYVGIAVEEERITSIADFSDIDARSDFGLLIETERFQNQHCSPILVAGKAIGALEVFNRRPFVASPAWNILFDAIATQTGLAFDYSMIYADLQKAYIDLQLSYDATIEGWSQAMDYRDQETEGHSQRVTSLAISLATRLGLSSSAVDDVKRGAMLHDIGKIGIPDSVLRKPGPLNDEEWEQMRKHPLLAYEMLQRIPYLKSCLDIPRYHHERWDGTGYPEKLSGPDIPLAARLFAIVDVFDALTSDRPYRSAWPKTKAIAYLEKNAGTQFDPLITDEFIRMIDIL